MKCFAKTLFILLFFLLFIAFFGVFGWVCIFAVVFPSIAKRFSILEDINQTSAFDDENSIDFNHDHRWMDDDTYRAQSGIDSTSAFDDYDSFDDDWYYYHRNDPFDD